MKKICIFLLFILVLGTTKAQFNFQSYVYSEATGSMVANYPVWVMLRDSAGNRIRSGEYRTDGTGLFADSLFQPLLNASMKYITYDCDSQVVSLGYPVSASPVLMRDTIRISCAMTNTDCDADYSYSYTSTDSLTIDFQLESDWLNIIGTNQFMEWDFGDGNTSTAQDPVHTYSLPGEYTVILRIREHYNLDSLDFCYSVYSQKIQVGQNPTINCLAGFETNNYDGDSLSITDTSSYTGATGLTKYVMYDYGDGSGGTSPSHYYNNPGTYQICQTIHVTAGSDTLCSSTYCDSLEVAPAISCNTRFNWEQMNDTLVLFERNDIVNNLPGGATVNTTINFGNGRSETYGNDTILVEVYFSGNYTVCQTLVVLDTDQDTLCTSTYCEQVVVQPLDSCHADFSYSADTISSYDYAFTEEADYHSGWQTRFTWTISQSGDADTLTGANVNYTFPNAGDFDVCMQVELLDSAQNVICSNVECKTIQVSQGSEFCNASYIVDTANSYNGEVIIWNMSTPSDSDPDYQTDYLWDFGDGSTSTQAFPTHTYDEEGVYPVCLSITSYNQNGDSCISSYCDTLGVDSNGQLIYKKLSGFVLRVMDPESIGMAEETFTEAKIYPNPARDLVYVEMDNSHLEKEVHFTLVDMRGQVMRSSEVEIHNGKFTLDVSVLSSGVYILSIESERSISHHRLKIDN